MINGTFLESWKIATIIEDDRHVPNAEKRPGPRGGRLLERDDMSKLLTRSFGLRNILLCLQKRKGNN